MLQRGEEWDTADVSPRHLEINMSNACSCLLHHGKWPCEASHRAASARLLLSAERSGGSRGHDGAPTRALPCPYRHGHDAGI